MAKLTEESVREIIAEMLEADRCECPHCMTRRQQAATRARVHEERDLMRASVEEREAAVGAMSAMELKAFVRRMGATAVDFLDGLSTSTRDQLLAQMTPVVRARVAFSLAPAVRRVIVRLASAGAKEVRTASVEISPLQARDLERVGLGGDVKLNSFRVASYLGLTLTQAGHVETKRAWKTRLKVDTMLAELVANGRVLVEPMPEEQSRDISVDEYLRGGPQAALPG